jgi:hypothetical protein
VVKPLFLDVDGVLNSTRSTIVKIGPNITTSEALRQLSQDVGGLEYGVTFALKCVDPVCVALVNMLLAQSGAALVLSSSHRSHFLSDTVKYGTDTHLELLRRYLTIMGINVPEAFSVTPRLHKERGYEIDGWLDHAYEYGIYDDDEQYVILDDGADMLPSQPLVLVDAAQGFSFENYAEACKHLGVDAPGLILL